MTTKKFLSCLYGSQHLEVLKIMESLFLSCLYGSQRVKLAGDDNKKISKLPIRQSTS